jgi:hypothetical protein
MAGLRQRIPPDVLLTHRVSSKDTRRLCQSRRVPGACDNHEDEGVIA